MITFIITIQEGQDGNLALDMFGRGLGTTKEVEFATALRQAINNEIVRIAKDMDAESVTHSEK